MTKTGIKVTVSAFRTIELPDCLTECRNSYSETEIVEAVQKEVIRRAKYELSREMLDKINS